MSTEGTALDLDNATYEYVVDARYARRLVFASVIRFTFGSPKVIVIFIAEVLLAIVTIGELSLNYISPVLPTIVLIALAFSLVIQPSRAAWIANRQIKSSFRIGEVIRTEFGPSSLIVRREVGLAERPYKAIVRVKTARGVSFVEGAKSGNVMPLVSQLCPPNQVAWLRDRISGERAPE